MISVYLIKLSDKPLTKEYEKIKVSFFDEIQKNRASLIGKLAVLYAASKILNLKKGELFFCYNENGKPYFKSHPHFHFNISHSADTVAVAISDSTVGIDIELLRETDLKIAKRFFSEKETEFIGNDNRRFFEIWTKKEAYLKQIGTGLKFPLSSFDVIDNPLIETFQKDSYIISVSAEKHQYTEFLYLSEEEFLNLILKK